jgi:hypothetical protein
MGRRDKKSVNYYNMVQGIGEVSDGRDYGEVSGVNNSKQYLKK